jgi:dihydrofolate reductase/thymidylate synthase
VLACFEVVVAADEAGGIGRGGALPWKLPGDAAFFKQLTRETAALDRRNAVVMGRRTWEAIAPVSRPLGGRLNVVLTRQARYPVPAGVRMAGGLEQALGELCAQAGLERVFVIGGGQIYRHAVPLVGCLRVHLTRVEGRFDCDTFLPSLGSAFRLVEQSDRHEEGGIGYVFQLWERAE